ncbi:MAG TPA: Zn-dependent hydrolase [Ktedonobacteraceae bacterium]|jgi:N-carbamoyl-L-amino-acid hydrolase
MLHINASRLNEALEKLATFHEDGSLYTRRSFTSVYQEAREWLKREMVKSGLSVQTDGAGNIVGRRAGRRTGVPALATGSHIDTVANGGRYDGMIGVLSALEVVRSINDAGLVLNHPLEIIDFLAEEPSAFGISTLGSRGMVGSLTEEMLNKQDDRGRRLGDCIRSVGGDPATLQGPLRRRGDLKAFLELHIEQGPVLEDTQTDIGVVTGIAGIHRYKVQIEGMQGHAGTVPMESRRDALVTAAKVVTAIQRIASEHTSAQRPVVATVGTFQVFPNHANVIPGSVTLSFEIRSIEQQYLRQIANVIIQNIQQISQQDHCTTVVEELSTSTPVLADNSIVEIVEQSAHTLGLSSVRLPSGAGHDTSHVAAIAPVGMIFVPCSRGISHHPDEYSSVSQIVHGAAVLAESLITIDRLQ